ncbi:hypothetical protein HMPREF1551_01827 [Capnocytophaga sp. oral taxon 863 str. F0517]|uniref:hypothetical protein n=1 Tax=Capnocytophaga sp. oral taxon 863 TaxID=1227265 RepID=UPI000396A54D|nr:hypothetical protein [Capnocytophaga sp. oral taxon 863]ERI62534.1 hypothetical protein HMPREF1551_01827 [Capnocytophaga sp. oral taxon 863 str. F0517]
MNTLRKELRTDFATAEKLYPLILKRLEDYEAFHDAQSEGTPKEVFDKEYKAMEQYLSELTGKDLSDTWLWEWWECNGIEAFAFDLAMPDPVKHNDLTREDITAFVRIIIDNEFECENDFQEEFMPYMFYGHQYFYKFLELNCPHFDPMAFNTTKDKKGKYHEPTVEEVMKKIWK